MKRSLFVAALAASLALMSMLGVQPARADQVVTTCGTSSYTAGVAAAPTIDTTGRGCISAPPAIAPVVSPSAGASLVVCAAACRLYGGHITIGTTAGFLLLFNAVTAPANGTVAPAMCIVVPASSTVTLAPPEPLSFSIGLTAVFSTTGCFTQTTSATAFFSIQAQ